jgi:hypothetical protein
MVRPRCSVIPRRHDDIHGDPAPCCRVANGYLRQRPRFPLAKPNIILVKRYGQSRRGTTSFLTSRLPLSARLLCSSRRRPAGDHSGCLSQSWGARFCVFRLLVHKGSGGTAAARGTSAANVSYRWGLIEDVHVGAGDPAAIARGRARLTAREFDAILTSSSEICGKIWALRFHAPLSRCARNPAFTVAFPWDWDRTRLYVRAGDPTRGGGARQAARRRARDALRPWSLQQKALAGAARARGPRWRGSRRGGPALGQHLALVEHRDAVGDAQHVPVTLGESEQARCRYPEDEKGQPVDYRVLQDDARRDRQRGGIAQTLEEHRAEKSRGPERRGDSRVIQEEPDSDRGGARETDQNSLGEYPVNP